MGFAAHGTGQSALILHWNGIRWARLGSPSLGTTSILFSVAATSAGNAWAVGDFAASGPSQALAPHCC